MKGQARFALFFAALALAGCGSPAVTTVKAVIVPDLTGNWQIQTNAGTQPGLLLLGALTSTGSQVTGTFRFTNLSEPASCELNQVVALSGAIDSNNNLALTSAALPNGNTVKASLVIGAAQPYAGTGAMEVDGAPCAFASTASIGELIANTTGTFTGTLTPGTLGSPTGGTTGTGTLVVTQTSIPGTDGQFSATGTLNYVIGTCTGAIPLSGAVSGVGLTLSGSNGTSPSPQTVGIVATANQTATTISLGLASFTPAPCSQSSASNADYFGTLNKQ